MPRLVKAHVDDADAAAFPALTGVMPEGNIATRAVITAAERPLHLWMHELPAASAICFSRPIVAHTMFLLEGETDAGGAVASSEGAVIVEHNADVTVRAKRPTRLLHFH